jgi:hypothetical protein
MQRPWTLSWMSPLPFSQKYVRLSRTKRAIEKVSAENQAQMIGAVQCLHGSFQEAVDADLKSPTPPLWKVGFLTTLYHIAIAETFIRKICCVNIIVSL